MPLMVIHVDLALFYYFLVAEYFVIQFIWSTLNEYSIFVRRLALRILFI
jgi:hypothetical protein